MRKLASVQKVLDIQPIDGADRIELVTINGWNVVSQKGIHKVGDLVAYFEIDSFLPVCDKFEFLRSSCFKSTKNLGDGFRIKSIKLRKQVSQGLIIPLSELLTEEEMSSDLLKEGLDLTEILGVQKYEQPIPANLAGTARGNFPHFIPKTDQERVQNLIRKRDYKTGDLLVSGDYEKSLKLDGSSMTVYFNDGVTGVCSRNLDLELCEDNESNAFICAANDSDLLNKVKLISEHLGCNIALQGELMGDGIQGNREKIVGRDFFLFDIFNITEQCYLLPSQRISVAAKFGIKHVPVLDKNAVIIDKDHLLDDLLDQADIESMSHKIAEGIVFKSNTDPEFSFKVINNKYLLKCEE